MIVTCSTNLCCLQVCGSSGTLIPVELLQQCGSLPASTGSHPRNIECRRLSEKHESALQKVSPPCEASKGEIKRRFSNGDRFRMETRVVTCRFSDSRLRLDDISPENLDPLLGLIVLA
jgi:hypothetical protein